MINQQLLDFIKSQLLKGVDKENITKDLIGAGWIEQDIQEGFNTIVSSTVNQIINPTTSNSINNPAAAQVSTHSGGKALPIIITLFVIALGTSVYFFRNDIPIVKDFIKSENLPPVVEIKQEENNQIQEQKEEIIASIQEPDKSNAVPESQPTSDLAVKPDDKKVVAPVTTTRTGPINCGTETKCFIAASKNCSPAFVEETKVLNIFGMVQTNKMKSTLYGLNSSKKCVYSSYVIDASLSYSPEIREQAKAAGATDEELKLQLAKSNESVKGTIGMITKCTFDTAYLNKLLIKWESGSSSSSDMDPGNCSITGGTLPASSTTIYISSESKETKNAGLKFNYIEVLKDSAKVLVTEISTGKESIVTYPLNRPMNIFGQTMTLSEVEERQYTINGEVFKYLSAGIEIVDK